jgi:hypothetical protein
MKKEKGRGKEALWWNDEEEFFFMAVGQCLCVRVLKARRKVEMRVGNRTFKNKKTSIQYTRIALVDYEAEKQSIKATNRK